MAAISFFLLGPAFLVILGIVITMAVVGAVGLIAGIGGSIVSATALKDKQIKATGLYFFISLLLLGISCLAVLGGIFSEVTFFIIPLLIAVGIAVVTLGIIGIIKILGVEKTAPKVIFTILLTISAILGALVFAAGIFALILGW